MTLFDIYFLKKIGEGVRKFVTSFGRGICDVIWVDLWRDLGFVTSFGRVIWEDQRFVTTRDDGGIKNRQILRDVIYGQPLTHSLFTLWTFLLVK